VRLFLYTDIFLKPIHLHDLSLTPGALRLV